MDIKTEINNTEKIDLNHKYNEELDNLLTSVREVGQIHDELNKMVALQSEKINTVEENTEKTADKVDASNMNLTEALDYKKSIFWKKGGLVTICTAAVATPAAIFLGPKIAVVAGVCTLFGVGYGVS